MIRTPYSTVITGLDLVSADRRYFVTNEVRDLIKRSGAGNVNAGELSISEDVRTDTRRYQISFGAYAWTGRL